MQLSAPAKINLSFRVLRRRDDGFHEIETLMAPISLHDTLVIERSNGGADVAFECDDKSVPSGEENLVVRAARRFFSAIGKTRGVNIRLTKRIPHGAGLGGGSSDAATTLVGLNKLFDAQLSRDKLATIGAEIGSDVPFFIYESAAICRGRGEVVTPTRLPPLSLLLLKPSFGVATAWAYQHWQNSRELDAVQYAEQELGELRLANDLERPVFEKFVFLARVKTWLLEQREISAALMSGSGSTIFAVLEKAEDASHVIERAREELDPELWTCVCRTL